MGVASRRARTVLKAVRTRLWDGHPFVLSHLLTARCNADCQTCLWKMPADSKADELGTAAIEALYDEAVRAGFTNLVMWGGEPFVRPDLGRLARHAHERGLSTTLITNGWWLQDRGDEVLPWIDRLLLSVDGLGPLHDEARRLPGLFERLDAGLKRTRSQYPALPVIVIAVISRLNAGHLRPIAEYGRDHGAQVLFQAMNFTDYGFAEQSTAEHNVRLDASAERAVVEEIEGLRKDGFPVRDSNAYLRKVGGDAFAYTCHYKKVALRVEPNGDVLDCTEDATSMMNVRSERLGDFVASARFEDFIKRSMACNRCRDAGVIEASHIWEGRVGALVNAIATLG